MTRSPRRLKAQVQETVSELPIHAARLAVMGVGQALLLTDRVRRDCREARQSGLWPVLGRLCVDAATLTGRAVGRVTGVAGDGTDTGTAAPGRRRTAADSEIAVGKPRRPSAASRPTPGGTRPHAGRTRPTSRPPAAGGRAAGARERTSAAGRAEGSTASGATAGPRPAAKAAPSAKATAPPAKAAPPAKTAPPAQATPGSTRPAPPKPAAPAATAGRAGTAPGELPVPGYDAATLASVRARLRNLTARQIIELRDYERAHAARAEFLRMYENRLNKLRGGS